MTHSFFLLLFLTAYFSIENERGECYKSLVMRAGYACCLIQWFLVLDHNVSVVCSAAELHATPTG